MNDGHPGRTDDPFLVNYSPNDLRIASEFLLNWLPYLSKGLCNDCVQTLSDRIRSLESETDVEDEPLTQEDNFTVSTPNILDQNDTNYSEENCDTNSIGSWKDSAEVNDARSQNDRSNGSSEPTLEASTSEKLSPPSPIENHKVRISWADMAQEDELEAEEENEESSMTTPLGEEKAAERASPKPELSRDQREYFRFSYVKRKKDFICLERIDGKIVNILSGLELHCGVFSAAEQKRIVDFIYDLRDKGKGGELKARTFTAPQKWMRGKGRVTIQFGCCYNYTMDKNGNPPGILSNETVDPIPPFFKVIIKRLVRWHVLPPSCVPDSCIVNIYEEGDCIPPHIDNHDFLRPFCTVSFLSECDILFGSNLKVVGPGEFDGPHAIPLPVGSVLVLNGNGADVAKHCVPAVPTRRISITFRKMDESKRPIGFVPEPDLQGLQPLSYQSERSPKRSNPKRFVDRQIGRRGESTDRTWVPIQTGSDPRNFGWTRQRPANQPMNKHRSG